MDYNSYICWNLLKRDYDLSAVLTISFSFNLLLNLKKGYSIRAYVNSEKKIIAKGYNV